MITYKTRPGCEVPSWFHAAFKKAAASKAVSSAADAATAALKAADDAEKAAHDTATHDVAFHKWVLADNNLKTAHTALVAVLAVCADVDFAAAAHAVNRVKVKWGYGDW